MTTAYEKAQLAGQNAVRTAILDAAIRLLADEGPAALTVRRISGDVGCSTKVIYTMFGGKDGLVEALWREGFARFGRALAAAPRGDDPVKHLAALGRAYRAYALAEPNYYRIMFEAAVPGFRPGPEAYAESRETLAILVGVVEECVKAGVFTEGEPAAIADTFWMAAHGAVSLELAGIFGPEEGERRFHMLTTALVRAYGTQSRPGPAEPDQERNRQ